MNHILIPCTSSAPDRAYDAVVLRVDDTLLPKLRTRRNVFDARAADSDLYAHEYQGGPLHCLHLDEDFLDAPEGPVVLTEHLGELELFGPWHLSPANGVYLCVVREGFFYTWDGRTEKHGPSEIYETEVFTVKQLQALLPATTQR